MTFRPHKGDREITPRGHSELLEPLGVLDSKYRFKEEEDLFIHLIRINNSLAKSTIFTDGRDKQRVTVNFFSVCPGDRSRIQEVNFTQRI